MRIVAIHETTASMRSEIRNAFIDFSQMTASAVAVVTDVVRDGVPVVGYGFNSNGRYAVGGLLRDRFIPRLLKADPASLQDEAGLLDPHRAWATMMTGEKPGGHGERAVAVGVLDMALWDALAKAEGLPLYRLIAQRTGNSAPKDTAWVYAAGGYYQPGKGNQALADELQGYLDLGYDTVKMKVGGAPLAEDVARIEAAIRVVGDGSRLAVDANGRFSLAEALAFGRAVAPYGLRWYEEAGDPLDYALNAELSARYDGPLATGENLFSHQDARNLVRYGGIRADRDVLQFDPVLSYGLVEYLRTVRMLEEHAVPRTCCVPHGGHLFALHIAAGLGLGGNESYPGVFQPFGGFPDGTQVVNGRVPLPQAPGIGYELKADLFAVFSQLAQG
ncbi:MAG: mandelate racemase/muconate lactonizing enzyme family protein [Chloroflexota bacterium]